MRVADVSQVGESSTGMQRLESAKPAKPTPTIEADYAETTVIATPPWKETVTGSDRQPAKSTPSAPAKSEADPSEAKERYIRRSPEGTIEARTPHRARPPRPRAAVPHPAPVVIRRPTPGLVANPRPTVVRLPNPVAVAIRGPAVGLIRHPNLSVIRSTFPAAVRVKVLGPDVILVRVVPSVRVVNHTVAVTVPAVPVIAIRSRGNFVSRICARSTDRGHVACLDVRYALRSGQLRLTFPDDNDGVAIGPDFNAVDAILVRRMQSHVRRVDLGLSLAFAENRVVHQPLCNLNLDVLLGEVRKIYLCARTQPQNICKIKLHLSPPPRSS